MLKRVQHDAEGQNGAVWGMFVTVTPRFRKKTSRGLHEKDMANLLLWRSLDLTTFGAMTGLNGFF